MSAESQNEALANYIMAEIPNEPSQSEGAGDTAIRLLKKYRQAFYAIIHELEVGQWDTPANVVKAGDIALAALMGE